MTKKSIIILITLFLISACETKFIKDGGTIAEFEQDKAQCVYEAKAATPNPSGYYRTIIGSSLDMALRQLELIKLCLKAKGWKQVS